MSEKVIIGKLLSPYGLKGDVEIELELDIAPKKIYLQNRTTKEFKAFSVSVKKTKDKTLCHIKGIDTYEQAKAFSNASVFIDEKDLPSVEEGIYLFELFGKEVKLDSGKTIGRLTNVFSHSNTDYIEIDYGKYIIPAKEPFLIKLDKDGIIISKEHFLFEKP